MPVYVPVIHEETPDDAEIKAKLDSVALNLDQQMDLHFQLSKSTMLSSRVRFLACEQLEMALSGLFP